MQQKNSKVSQKTLDAAEAKAKQFDDVKTEKMGNPKGGKGNSKEKIPKQVERELGIDPKQLKDKIHDSKRTEKKKGKDNYEWDEVMEMGKDLPKKKK